MLLGGGEGGEVGAPRQVGSNPSGEHSAWCSEGFWRMLCEREMERVGDRDGNANL
jgi:hypothetical protein